MKPTRIALRTLVPLATCAVLAGCATTPEQDPVVQRLTELDGRLLRIERVLANQSLLQLSQRIDEIRSRVLAAADSIAAGTLVAAPRPASMQAMAR